MRARAQRGGLPQGVTLPALSGSASAFLGMVRETSMVTPTPRKARAVSGGSLHCKDR